MSEPEPKTNGESDDSDDDDLGVSYRAGGTGPDREGMVSEYLAGEEEWSAKSVLDLHDPAREAGARVIGELFPECSHHQPIIDEFLDNFLKARTSVGGRSRDEFKKIFVSMYGGHPDDDTGSVLEQALAADLYEDD